MSGYSGKGGRPTQQGKWGTRTCLPWSRRDGPATVQKGQSRFQRTEPPAVVGIRLSLTLMSMDLRKHRVLEGHMVPEAARDRIFCSRIESNANGRKREGAVYRWFWHDCPGPRIEP